MFSEKHVYFDVIHAHTRCMLLYVDTYCCGVKCEVFIDLTQNVHTGRPPNALPSSTQSYFIALGYCCTAEYFRCIVLSASCNELWLTAPSIAAVSYFAIS